jgi:hypothetical protein
LTIRLVPWGTITGRFLDAEGTPMENQLIELTTRNGPDRPESEGLPGPHFFRSDRAMMMTDREGWFRIDGRIPGLTYGSTPFDMARRLVNPPSFHDVIVAPGEVKDLGDLKAPPPKPKVN